MAVKIVEDSAVLTLDFWDKETIYNGQVFPVGTLACDALNIPGEVVSHMEKLCEKLNGFMKTFDSGKGDPTLLPEAKFSAMKLLELMAKYKPFSYINMTAFRDLVKRCFTPNGVKSANALIQALKNSKLSDQIADKDLDGALLSRLLPTLAHFGHSLKACQETMLPFAQRLHDSEDRARADYARIFDSYFPKEPTFEDASDWMSITHQTLCAKSCATKPPVSLDASCHLRALPSFGFHPPRQRRLWEPLPRGAGRQWRPQSVADTLKHRPSRQARPLFPLESQLVLK